MRDVHGILVRGVDVDPETRCAHYRTDRDVVALKFGCCESYFPCFRCHDAVAGHPREPWPRERFDEPAALCGRCGLEMTAATYLDLERRTAERADGGDDGYACPSCAAAFNPDCARHVHLYFDVDERGDRENERPMDRG